jgi:hypothetical protein
VYAGCSLVAGVGPRLAKSSAARPIVGQSLRAVASEHYLYDFFVGEGAGVNQLAAVQGGAWADHDLSFLLLGGGAYLLHDGHHSSLVARARSKLGS